MNAVLGAENVIFIEIQKISSRNGFDHATDVQLGVAQYNKPQIARLAGIYGVKLSDNLKPAGGGDGGEDGDQQCGRGHVNRDMWFLIPLPTSSSVAEM